VVWLLWTQLSTVINGWELSWDFLYQFSSNNDNFIYNHKDLRIPWHWSNTIAHSGSFSQHGGPCQICGGQQVIFSLLQCPHLNASAPYPFIPSVILWDTITAAIQRDWVSSHPMTSEKNSTIILPGLGLG